MHILLAAISILASKTAGIIPELRNTPAATPTINYGCRKIKQLAALEKAALKRQRKAMKRMKDAGHD